MINFYDDLFFSTGADGACTPVGTVRDHDGVDLDVIMDAWFQERRESIECSMFLERAKKLLGQILVDEELTPRARKKVRNFIRSMKECRG